MNLLEKVFLFLTVFMLVSGLLINYGSAMLPTFIVQAFRYGRANISNTKSKYIRNIEVPKRWFYHFYIYAVVLQLAVIVTVVCMDQSNFQNTWLTSVLMFIGERPLRSSVNVTLLAIVLFWIHLCRRLYETLYVSVYSNTKMNLFHYALAYLHYTGAVLCLVAHSPFVSTKTSEPGVVPEYIGYNEIIAAVTVLIGNYLQNRAHVGLASLRKGKDKKETSGHRIPSGYFLFEYVSCPNYFAEILIYCGLAGVFGFQNSSWNCCMLWVACNQVTSGIMNHRWYLETFKDYPKQRKAVIPFLL